MTPTTAPTTRRAALVAAGLLTGLLLSACSSDDDTTESSAPEGPAAGSAGTVDGSSVAPEGESNDYGQRLLEPLGSSLSSVLPDVESYDVDGDTLTIHFSTGSKDDVNSRCLIATTAADSLVRPGSYSLVMSYPDGEQECARS